MSDSWAYYFPLPARYATAEPADLSERITDALAAQGFTWNGGRPELALSKLGDDDTRLLYVNCQPDPTSIMTSLGVAEVSAATQQARALATRLQMYLDTPAPTAAQSAAALKDVIRALRYVWLVG